MNYLCISELLYLHIAMPDTKSERDNYEPFPSRFRVILER